HQLPHGDSSRTLWADSPVARGAVQKQMVADRAGRRSVGGWISGRGGFRRRRLGESGRDGTSRGKSRQERGDHGCATLGADTAEQHADHGKARSKTDRNGTATTQLSNEQPLGTRCVAFRAALIKKVL